MSRLVKTAIAAALLGAGFSYGFLAHKDGLFPARQISRVVVWFKSRTGAGLMARDGGLWGRRRAVADNVATADLAALPYVSGSRPAASEAGVRVWDPDRAYPGVNLYTSAHAPEALLIDAEGMELHRWAIDPDDVWPEIAGKNADSPYRYFRRVRLLPDGGMLVIFEYRGMVRIDADSQLIWALQEWNHHDLDLDDEGRIYVLGRQEREAPQVRQDGPIWDESVTILDDQGQVLDRIWILDALERSRYAPLLDVARRRGIADAFHLNTVAWIDGSLAEKRPLFARGNLLISIRNLDTVAILDPERREVVWALTGGWKQQHEPLLLADGRMMLFDNRTGTDRSRVIEFDPFTQDVLWEYRGTEDRPFYSSLQGSVQRLPNGNTLITESDFGRAFEVTPAGETVWEFVNPNTTGAGDEYVAVVPEVIRLGAEFPIDRFVP